MKAGSPEFTVETHFELTVHDIYSKASVGERHWREFVFYSHFLKLFFWHTSWNMYIRWNSGRFWPMKRLYSKRIQIITTVHLEHYNCCHIPILIKLVIKHTVTQNTTIQNCTKSRLHTLVKLYERADICSMSNAPLKGLCCFPAEGIWWSVSLLQRRFVRHSRLQRLGAHTLCVRRRLSVSWCC